MKEDKDVQISTLIYCMGSEAEDIFAAFTWDHDDDQKDPDKVMKCFDKYFIPRHNVIYERASQEDGEPIETYVRAVYQLTEIGVRAVYQLTENREEREEHEDHEDHEDNEDHEEHEDHEDHEEREDRADREDREEHEDHEEQEENDENDDDDEAEDDEADRNEGSER